MHNRSHQLISHHRVLQSLLELLLVVEVVGVDVGVGLLVGGEDELDGHGWGLLTVWGRWLVLLVICLCLNVYVWDFN